MKTFFIIISLLLCIGCSSPKTSINVQANLINYSVGDMHSRFNDGENDWCEWHDAATFKILKPKEREGTILTVFFPSEVNNDPLRAIVGTKYEFIILEEYLDLNPSSQIFDGALQDLKEIKYKSNQSIEPIATTPAD